MARFALGLLSATLTLYLVHAQFGNFDIIPDYGLAYLFNNRNNIFPDNYAPCVTGDASGNLEGTCTHSPDCKFSGGRGLSRGNCTYLNTCCISQKTCGQTSRSRVTYFRQPATPRLTTPRTCTLTIQKLNDNICQIRVDIISMNLIQPTMTTVMSPGPPATTTYTYACTRDKFQVRELTTDEMNPICGTESNNHFYVHLEEGQREIHLDMFLQAAGVNTVGADWNIKVTQLECPGREDKFDLNKKKQNRNQAALDYPNLAPDGCLQYFTAYSGTVKSFNYNRLTGSMTTGNDYAACFKRFGDCNIQFTENDVRIGNTALTPCPNYIFVPESMPVAPNVPNTMCYFDATVMPPVTGTPGIFTEIQPGPEYIHIFNPTSSTMTIPGFELAYTQDCTT